MTNFRSAFGAFLVLLAVFFLATAPAFALTSNTVSTSHGGMLLVIVLGAAALGLAGTATITYVDPVQLGGGTTAPTTTQASHTPAVVAQVVLGDADTTATITHNMGLSTSQLTELRPWLRVVGLVIGTAYPALSWALNTNTVVCTKGNTSTGSGGTYEVVVERPGPLVSSAP